MYCNFHGLKTLPFENTPDPRFFFLSEDHREALANLVYAARSQKGLVLITGDIGMGKTTTSYFLEARLGEAAKIAVVRHVPATPKQLLWNISDELGLAPSNTATRAQLVHAIHGELMRQHELNRTVLLMFDEAQALPVAVLDEIRLLSNMETQTSKLCQILLIGQSELRQVLQNPRLEALRQRIVLAHHIGPLSLQNTHKYIGHRLRRAADGQPPAAYFTDAAIDRIHAISHGVIRQINVIADQSLLVASVRKTHAVDVEEVNEAVQPMAGLIDVCGKIEPEAPMREAA